MKKLAILALVAGAMSAPAFADGTTLENVISKGVVLEAAGYTIPVTYSEDGSYVSEAFGSEITGTWRIDGTSLCTTSSMQPTENCTEYPEGVAPGESFEIVSPAIGPMKITINE